GLGDGIVVCEKDGAGRWIVVRTNAAFDRLTGRPAGSAVGQPVVDLAAPSELADLEEAVVSGRPVEREGETTLNGKRVVVASRTTPVFDEQGQCSRIIV